MTTLGEISKKLNVPDDYDFELELYDVDIGDYSFTNYETDDDGWFTKYINNNNPNIVLLYNEERNSVTLYVASGDKVEATTWRYDDKFTKTFDKKELKGIF